MIISWDYVLDGQSPEVTIAKMAAVDHHRSHFFAAGSPPGL